MFSRLSVSRFEAAFAALVILLFCSLSFGVAAFFAFSGTKIYLSYACTSVVASGSGDDSPLDHFLSKTCRHIGDMETSLSYADAMGFTLLRYMSPLGPLVVFLVGWITFLFTLAVTIPQAICAWDLLRTSTNSKSSTEFSLICTWRHQSIQNVIIFMELLITIVLTVFVLASPAGAGYQGIEDFVNLMIKILTGRVFCAFFVEIYFHEQLLVVFSSGQKLHLPSEYQEQFEKEFHLGGGSDDLVAVVVDGKKPILLG